VLEPEESDVCLIPDDQETEVTEAEKEQARENAEKAAEEEEAEERQAKTPDNDGKTIADAPVDPEDDSAAVVDPTDESPSTPNGMCARRTPQMSLPTSTLSILPTDAQAGAKAAATDIAEGEQIGFIFGRTSLPSLLKSFIQQDSVLICNTLLIAFAIFFVLLESLINFVVKSFALSMRFVF